MTIQTIKITTISIPLKYTFSTALRSTNQVHDYIIKIQDLSGNIGYGSTTAVTAVTGHSEHEINKELELVKKYLINKNINNFDDIKSIISNINFSISNNTKNAIVMALFDLLSHKLAVPLYKLINNKALCQAPIETSITISLTDHDAMVKQALFWHSKGFRIIKLKLGTTPKQDLKLVANISNKLLETNTQIIVDFNQAYNVIQTIEFMNNLAKIDHLVTMIEQPTLKNHLEYLKIIKFNSDLPIIADEACFTIDDLKKLIDLEAADGINIKLIKCGGIINAIEMHRLATLANLKIMVGCMLECPIGITAATHFTAAMGNIAYTDLDPLALIAHNPIKGGAKIINNKIYLNQTPGLGILE